MDKEKLIRYWLKSANIDYSAMNSLFKTGHYSWALFIGHLVIEKMLKACYVKYVDNNPPHIHDLLRIAEKSGLQLDQEQRIQLDTITKFNINARYDSEKLQFYKICTRVYVANWIKNIKELRKWINNQHFNS